jgi:GT2 family glycosyltransferase
MDFEFDNMKAKTCVIITTYAVVPKVEQLYASLEATDIQLVIIADNSENSWIADELRKSITAEFSEYFHYIKNDNIGKMAGAINKGFEFAMKNDYELALLLDDDAFISKRLVKEELNCYYEFKNKKLQIGAICPIVTNEFLLLDRIMDREKYSFTRYAITSGLMVVVKEWERVGGFDEKFPLDAAYLFFTRKLIVNESRIIRINEVLIAQSFGISLEKENLSTSLLGLINRMNFIINYYFNFSNDMAVRPRIYYIEREKSIYMNLKRFKKVIFSPFRRFFFFPLIFLGQFLKFLITGDIEYVKVVIYHDEIKN